MREYIEVPRCVVKAPAEASALVGANAADAGGSLQLYAPGGQLHQGHKREFLFRFEVEPKLWS